MFHLLDEPVGGEGRRLGLGELPEIHGQIIMPRRGVGFARQQFPAGGDALPGDRGASGVVGGEVGIIKTGAGKLPGGGGIVRG